MEPETRNDRAARAGRDGEILRFDGVADFHNAAAGTFFHGFRGKIKRELDRNLRAQLRWGCSWSAGSDGDFPKLLMMRAGWNSKNKPAGIGAALFDELEVPMGEALTDHSDHGLREREDFLRDGEDLLRDEEDLLRDEEDLLRDEEDLLKDGEDLLRDEEDLLRDGEDLLRDEEDLLRDEEDLLRYRKHCLDDQDNCLPRRGHDRWNPDMLFRRGIRFPRV